MRLFRSLGSRTLATAAIGIVIALIGVLVASGVFEASDQIDSRDVSALTATTAASTVHVPQISLVSLDGRPISTRSSTGQVIVIWSSECDCTDLFRVANNLVVVSQDEFQVIGISLDTELPTAAQTAYERSLLFPSAIDPSGAIVNVLPSPDPGFIVVEPDGTAQTILPKDSPLDEVVAAAL